MKSFVAFLFAAVLAAGGWWYYRHRPARSGTESTSASRPNTATIETRSIRFAVSAAGEITPSEQVSVRPEVNGKIDVLPVDVSDVVQKDALLFKLDDRDLKIEKQSQETAIERARLELDQTQRDFTRAQRLYEDKLLSLEAFEDVRTRHELARNNLIRTQTSLDLILDKLRRTEIKAPFDCTVLTRPVSVGQAVSGSGGFNSGTEVLTIANLNDLVINAHINQADITRIKVDQDVEVAVEAVPGLKVVGKVERIAPQAVIRNNLKGYATRVLLKDVDRRVRPGMTANISIPVASANNVVAAPLAGIFTETNPDTKRTERFVYIKSGDEWEKRPVQIGVSDYFFVEVTKGLAVGDEISLEDRSKVAKPAADKLAASNSAISNSGAAIPAKTASVTR